MAIANLSECLQLRNFISLGREIFFSAQRNKNSYLKEEYLRQDVNASRLYYGYHYNTSAKKRSNEIEVVKITDSYIHLVMEIQKSLAFFILNEEGADTLWCPLLYMFRRRFVLMHLCALK